MSGLKTLSPPGGASTLSGLKTSNTPVASIASPRSAPKVFGGSSMIAEPVKFFVFGEPGTGKTWIVKELLEAGFKVYYISTDIGGSGMASFTGSVDPQYLNDDCFRWIEPFEDFGSLRSFILNPTKTDPEFYNFDADWIVWDGFAGFQQFLLSIEIMGGDNVKISDMQVEGKEWGPVKIGTLNLMHKFLSITNPKTGKLLHKLVTCHEDVRNQGGGLGSAPQLGGDPQGTAWIQGAARQVVAGAFDVIFHSRIDKKDGFVYDLTKPLNQQPKYRGKVLKDLPSTVPAEIMSHVEFQFKNRKITRGMTDPKLIVKAD